MGRARSALHEGLNYPSRMRLCRRPTFLARGSSRDHEWHRRVQEWVRTLLRTTDLHLTSSPEATRFVPGLTRGGQFSKFEGGSPC